MTRWRFSRFPSRPAVSAGSRPAPDDAETRARAQEIVKWTVLFLFGASCVVGIGPLVFNDHERARYAITAFFAGLVALGLARAVVLRMAAEIEGAAEFEGTHDEETPAGPAVGQPVQLQGVDLREAVLSGSDLEELELSGALLERAALAGARLCGSRLVGTDLRRADLRETNLTGANLAKADLRGANLKGATIDRAWLQGAVYDGATVWPDDAPAPGTLGAVHASEIAR